MEICSGVALISIMFSILISYMGKRLSRETRKFSGGTKLFRLVRMREYCEELQQNMSYEPE